MGVTLKEADETLKLAVLHGGSEFPVDRRHRAIRASGNHLLRRTGLSRRLDDITTTAGQRELDLPAGLGQDSFLAGQLYDLPFLDEDFNYLAVQNFNEIRKLYVDYETQGKPERLAFLTPTKAFLFPIPDKQYTIRIPWYERLTDFEIGTPTPGDVELNVPRIYADDWIYWGARAFLLYGSDGHPDANPAMAQFNAFCDQIRGETSTEGVWINEPYTESGRVFDETGYV